MSDYVKSTDFASKDTLPSGDSAKIVRGTEIDAEFEALEVAIASKANTSDVSSTYAPLNSPTFTGSPVLPTGTTAVTQTAGDNDTSVATTAFVTTAVAALGYPAFKNRIINGAMMIDQRNAGASVTPANNSYGGPDRWSFLASQASKFSAQQNLNSVTPPTGFTKYLGYSVTSAVSVGASDYFASQQIIEGFNFADLGWGTASAQPITVSFWVRSSLTGTFNIVVGNASFGRGYAAVYSINSANTWEQKTITIAGDTSGTWPTDNSASLRLCFNLGAGSSASAAAGSWGAWVGVGATGAVSLVGTLGATFYITGVQLEKGTTATSFDFRSYGTELALCQRYYTKSYDMAVVPGTANPTGNYGLIEGSVGAANSTSLKSVTVVYPVPMRTQGTVTLYDIAGNINKASNDNVGSYTNNQSASVNNGGERSFGAFINNGVSCATLAFFYTASAEL